MIYQENRLLAKRIVCSQNLLSAAVVIGTLRVKDLFAVTLFKIFEMDKYFLRYTVQNSTSLLYFNFHWLAPARRGHNVLHFRCLFEGKMLLVH